MIPTTYQSKPDRDWKRWVGGNVTPADLHRYRPDNEYLFINGIMVYALCFVTDQNPALIWNCKTGWQTKGML